MSVLPPPVHPTAMTTPELAQKLTESIQKFDVESIKKLMPAARAHSVILDYRFRGDALNDVEPPETLMQGPPLCVLIECIKTHGWPLKAEIPSLFGAVLLQRHQNDEFDVVESWPELPDTPSISMRCAAMSWLLHPRDNVEFNCGNLQCCIATLIALGVDVRLPYTIAYSVPSGIGDDYVMRRIHINQQKNGSSLPFVAMAYARSLKCAQALLDGGARFLPDDPPPLVVALKKFHAATAVRFIYDNWKKGHVGKDGSDVRGNTAIHVFICYPPRDAWQAVESLKLLLDMGFSPMTRRRDGVTALRLAEEEADDSDANRAIYLHLRDAGPIAIETDRVLQARKLPHEICSAIWELLGNGVPIEKVQHALKRVKPLNH